MKQKETLLTTQLKEEKIALSDLLRPKISETLDLKIRLYETERNFVDYPA